jgi:hypothetical protein
VHISFFAPSFLCTLLFPLILFYTLLLWIHLSAKPIKTLVQVNNEAIESLLANAQEQGQVIMHCMHYGCSSECGKTLKCELKLNPNVQLIPTNGSRPSKLIQTYNINLPPGRTFKNSYGTEFTLIFTGLPKNCTEFDFIEPDEGGKGWEAKNIKRNKTDVYKLFISPTGAWEGETKF